MKGQRNCSLSAWFPSLEKRLERNDLENSYLILTWLQFTYKTLLSNRNIRLFANVLLLLGNHRLNWIWYGLAISNEPPHKTHKMTCTPGDDSDEPGRPPSLIRVSADRMNKLPIERLAKTLIRLNGCSGWSESSLGSHSDCWFCPGAAKIILFVYKFHI